MRLQLGVHTARSSRHQSYCRRQTNGNHSAFDVLQLLSGETQSMQLDSQLISLLSCLLFAFKCTRSFAFVSVSVVTATELTKTAEATDFRSSQKSFTTKRGRPSSTEIFLSSASSTSNLVTMERGVGGRIEDAFAAAKEKGEAAFVTFVTAGYPSAKGTRSMRFRMYLASKRIYSNPVCLVMSHCDYRYPSPSDGYARGRCSCH